MATPQPPRSTQQNVARQASRANPGSLGGRRAGLAPVRGTAAPAESTAGGLKECFTIPDFVPGTHNIGYDHWICDPNGTFDET